MAARARIPHPSIDERRAQGKEARTRTPPASHAGWMPATDRPDPVALLKDQNRTREPDLVPVRHGRMLVSPFSFYRGTAKIMAADLDGTPTAGLQAQLCGDAHLSNFGLFASPERRLLFDLNDFDETLPGPFEYDVKRLAASFTMSTPLAHTQRVDDPGQVVVAEPVQLLSDLAWRSECVNPRTSSCMGQIAMVASRWCSGAVGRDVAAVGGQRPHDEDVQGDMSNAQSGW